MENQTYRIEIDGECIPVTTEEVLELYPKQHNLMQDELAAEINDSDCTFGQCYVRFIETE